MQIKCRYSVDTHIPSDNNCNSNCKQAETWPKQQLKRQRGAPSEGECAYQAQKQMRKKVKIK